MFPFSISSDPLTGVADMSHLLDAPAGATGRVRVADGHFVTDKGRIRLNAVNLTGPANFPSHHHAERMAARLAGLGVNCVRLHFMDCQKGYGSFWQERQQCLLKDGEDPLAYEIDEKQFEKLDYLVAQFKKRGIYVNVNLHVARLMAYLLEGRTSLKGATWFSRELIDSEKQWARDFLGHFNPHTGMTWAEDPVVAVVELNNEDALLNILLSSLRGGSGIPCREELEALYGDTLPGAGDITPDFIRFVLDTEEKYVAEMCALIHGELGCAAPVTGSQVTYTPLWPELAADYLDAHEYWCHPYPINAEWKILDYPQVNHPEANCVSWLTARAATGLPYTVSEYNNPYPNRYGTEGQLLLHAYGAFQDWDGIFAYSYDNRADGEPDHVEYFFSLVARTDVLAHFPACAALFLRGDVSPARETVTAPSTREDWIRRFSDAAKRDIAFAHPWDDTFDASGGALPYSLGLTHGTRLTPLDEASSQRCDGQTDKLTNRQTDKRISVWQSDTGELTWDVSLEGGGYVAVSTENVKVFTGFVRGRVFDLGGVRLKIGHTEGDWATVSLVSHDATGFGGDGRAARILLAATGRANNGGAVFTELERNEAGEAIIASRGDDWGKGPFEVEGVPAEITLPSHASRTRCWALDGRGCRLKEVPVCADAEGRAVIVIGPDYRTVWYEMEISPK